MKNKKLYIHIGKGRTATTYMQEYFFSKHSEINYIAKSNNNYPQWIIDWHYLDDFHFEKEFENIKQVLDANLSEDKINVISSEAFYELGGGWYKQLTRIKKVFPSAKIIITLREPIDSIMSFIQYNIKTNDYFFKSFQNIIDFYPRPHIYYKRKPIYLPDYFYDEVIHCYEEQFGTKNIKVLKYEDFVKDKKTFFDNLCLFLNISCEILPREKKINSSQDFCINDKLYQNFIEIFKQSDIYEVNNPNVIDKNNLESLKRQLKEDCIPFLQGKCFGYY